MFSPQTVLKFRLVFFYGFTFTISWTAWGLMYVSHGDGDAVGFLTLVFSSIGGLGPLLSLAILQRLTGKQVDVKKILNTIRLRDSGFVWFIPAALVYPLAAILGNLLSYWFGHQSGFQLIKPGPADLGIGVLPVILIQFAAGLITSPLFEEPGWRGFALGELQSRYGREVGSLLVGALWWAWHQPMNLTFGIEPSLISFVSMVTFSFLIDSLFNLSGRNLLTAMLAHQSSSTVFNFLQKGENELYGLFLLLIVVLTLRLLEWNRTNTSGQVTSNPVSL